MDEVNVRRMAALAFEIRTARVAIIKAIAHATALQTDSEVATLHKLWELRTELDSAVGLLSTLPEQLRQVEHNGMGPDHAAWCSTPWAHVIPDRSEMTPEGAE